MEVDYGVVIAMILAISLAGERIVAIVKTMMPGWFAEPAAVAPDAPRPSITADRGRRLRVQGVAFASCWLAAASLGADGFAFLGSLDMGGLALPTALVGLLAMGGSAFWAQLLGISSALKDLKSAEASSARAAATVAQAQAQQAPAPAPATVHLPNTEIAKPEPEAVG